LAARSRAIWSWRKQSSEVRRNERKAQESAGAGEFGGGLGGGVAFNGAELMDGVHWFFMELTSPEFNRTRSAQGFKSPVDLEQQTN